MYLLFLRMHLDCNQKNIVKYFKRNKYFLKDKDWYDISRFQKLSEDFIREFQHQVWWERISYRQKLSEEFIREFQNRLDWRGISLHQKLSKDFIREFQDQVRLEKHFPISNTF